MAGVINLKTRRQIYIILSVIAKDTILTVDSGDLWIIWYVMVGLLFLRFESKLTLKRYIDCVSMKHGYGHGHRTQLIVLVNHII